MNITELRQIHDKFNDLVATILKNKDETDWDEMLQEYQQAQEDLFAMDFDNVDEANLAEVRRLIAEINVINDTLINMSKPFYKKISEQLKQLRKGAKVNNSYNENSE